VRPSEDAYVYLFSFSADGELVQVLPNRFDGGSTPSCAPADTRTFPPEGARYSFNVAPPRGLAKVIAVASREPLDVSTLASFRTEADFATSSAARTPSPGAAHHRAPLPQNDWVSATALYYVGQRPEQGAVRDARGRQRRRGAPRSTSTARSSATRPLRYGLRPGTYDVEVVPADGTYQERVQIRPDRTTEVFATLRPRVRTGSARFTSEPSGAEVYVDGSFEGTTPIGAHVRRRPYEAEFRRDGFETRRVPFEVQRRPETRVSAELRAQTGTLEVTANVGGARVFLDGREVGRIADGTGRLVCATSRRARTRSRSSPPATAPWSRTCDLGRSQHRRDAAADPLLADTAAPGHRAAPSGVSHGPGARYRASTWNRDTASDRRHRRWPAVTATIASPAPSARPAKRWYPLRDVPMGAYVATALRDSGLVDDVVWVGPADGHVRRLVDVALPAGNRLVDSLTLGLGAAMGRDRPARVCSWSPPTCRGGRRKACVLRARRARRRPRLPDRGAPGGARRFPDQRRTFVRLAGGRYSGGNAVLLSPRAVPALLPRIETAVPGAQAPLRPRPHGRLDHAVRRSSVGHGAIAIEARVGHILGVTRASFVSSDAAIAADVDGPDHLPATLDLPPLAEVPERARDGRP
jgi:hypothetical protein